MRQNASREVAGVFCPRQLALVHGVNNLARRCDLPERNGGLPVCKVPELSRIDMGRGILLWLLGVPIPIIILIALLYH